MIWRCKHIFLVIEIIVIAVEYSGAWLYQNLFIRLPLMDMWLVSNLGIFVNSVSTASTLEQSRDRLLVYLYSGVCVRIPKDRVAGA